MTVLPSFSLRQIESSVGGAARHYELLVLVLICEAVLFYVQVATNIATLYPRHFDQVGYLTQVYELAHAYRSQGFEAALAYFRAIGSPSTTFFYPLGALFVLLTDLPRAGALTVNLFYFILLQLCLFWLIQWRRKSYFEAWLGIASVLLLSSTFYLAGGIFDFRLDFSALCLFGIWTCLVLRSEVFLSLRWSLLAGLVAAWLIGNRHIAVTYYAPVMGVLFLITWAQGFLSRECARRIIAWRRTKYIFLSGLPVLAVSVFILALKFDAIYEKYFVSMFISAQKEVRAKEFVPGNDLLGHLSYYPKSIFYDHLGATLFTVLVLVLFGLVIVGVAARWRSKPRPYKPHPRLLSEQVFLSVTIIVPLLVLNLSIHKSPVIGGILSVPVLLLALSFLWRARDRLDSAEHRPHDIRRAMALARVGTAVIVVLSLTVFSYRAASTRADLPFSEGEISEINHFQEKVARFQIESGSSLPTFWVDRVADFTISFNLTAFEQFRILIRSGYQGTDIFAPAREQLFNDLPKLDLLILTSPDRRDNIYPADETIRSYWTDLMAWAQDNRVLLTEMTILRVPYRAYVRPMFKITGLSGDNWVISEGTTLEVDASFIPRWPKLVIAGPAVSQLPAGTRAKAVLLDGNEKPVRELPTETNLMPGRYEVTIDGSGAEENAHAGKVKIAVSFDGYFVPKDLGINPDTRRLVFNAPTRREMKAATSQ